MIDPNGLMVFVAIAEEHSFSLAARRLGVAQSAISKRLLRLEDQLGASLIDRSNRTSIKLTRFGELYLPEAHRTLSQLRKAERIGMALAQGRLGPVRIGYIFSAAMNGCLPTLLSCLGNSLPNIELQPRLMETPQQLDALEKGDLEIGLTRPRPSYPSNCRKQLIAQDCLKLFTAASHPLSRKQSLYCRELAGECFIVPQFPEQVGLIVQVEELAAIGGFQLGKVIRTDDFVTAASLVASGAGIALAPVSLSSLCIQGLVANSIADYQETLDQIMVYPADLPRDLSRVLESLSIES